MKKVHHPINNLGKYAHAPNADRTNFNFAKPPKVQTEPKPHLAAPHKGDKGRHSHPPMRKG